MNDLFENMGIDFYVGITFNGDRYLAQLDNYWSFSDRLLAWNTSYNGMWQIGIDTSSSDTFVVTNVNKKTNTVTIKAVKK